MCVFWTNNTEISVYAKEVDYNTTLKVSFTFEISSKDIAGCKIEDEGNLLSTLIGKMLISKIQLEGFFNFEEIKNDERFSEKDGEEVIAGIKQFMEDYPDGFKEGGDKDKSKETITDGFSIKVEVVWEKDQENWVKAVENWKSEHGAECMSICDAMELEHEEFRIEVAGKAVDVNELMSMVNEYHQSLDNWTCEFPVDYMSAA